jgi:alpha-L-fucosidase
MVDTFKPDMLYSDVAVPFYRRNATTLDPTYESGLSMVSHLYNSSAAENGGVNQAIYFQKDSRKEFYDIGLLDIERSLAPEIAAAPWQTDTCLGHWFYDVRAEYKTYDQVIGLLVDIISKNGNLLLNVPQKPDGTIDDECKFVLDKLGEWFAVCGEAVYGTRPYSFFGEGPTGVQTENRAEGRNMSWTPYDFRYTRKGDTIYAFIMGRPGTATLHKLAEVGRVKRVRLLGMGELPFARDMGVLTVRLPETLPLDTVNCLAIDV